MPFGELGPGVVSPRARPQGSLFAARVRRQHHPHAESEQLQRYAFATVTRLHSGGHRHRFPEQHSRSRWAKVAVTGTEDNAPMWLFSLASMLGINLAWLRCVSSGARPPWCPAVLIILRPLLSLVTDYNSLSGLNPNAGFNVTYSAFTPNPNTTSTDQFTFFTICNQATGDLVFSDEFQSPSRDASAFI